jgi:hypothetical protein
MRKATIGIQVLPNGHGIRPRPSPLLDSHSRNGSQARTIRPWLALGGEIGRLKSVVTSLAGFESAESVVTLMAGLPALPDPSRLEVCACCFSTHAVACLMRRTGHPSFPSAITCCFLTLLALTEAIRPLVRVNVPGFIVGRFQVTLPWPVLSDH